MTASSTPPLPTYFHNLDSRDRELKRLTAMARELSHTLISTGFTAQDVALAFMQVGMGIANDVAERDAAGEMPDMTALLHRSAVGER